MISRITSVLCIAAMVIAILAVIAGIVTVQCSGAGFAWIKDVIGAASEHELTGGYEVLGALGLGILDVLLFMVGALGIFFGIYAFLPAVVPAVYFIVEHIGGKKTEMVVKTDGVIKTVNFLVWTIIDQVFFTFAVGSFRTGILFALPLCFLLILSLLQLYFLSE